MSKASSLYFGVDFTPFLQFYARAIGWLTVVPDVLARVPQVAAINQMHAGINWHRDHLHELRPIPQQHTRT